MLVPINSQITINACACINSNSTIRIVDYMVNLACRTQNGIHNGIRVGTSNLIISSIGLIAAWFPITTTSFTVAAAGNPDIRILNIILICDIITCSKSVITISNMNIINIIAGSIIFKITIKLYPEVLRAVNITIRKSIACSTGNIIFASAGSSTITPGISSRSVSQRRIKTRHYHTYTTNSPADISAKPLIS